MVLDWNVVFGYIDAHNWAALGWTGVSILLLVWKRYKLAVWDKLPRLVKFGIPILVAMLTDAVQGVLEDGESTMVALWTGLLFALSLQGVFSGLKATPGITRALSARRPVCSKGEVLELDTAGSTELSGEVTRIDSGSGVVALQVEPEVAKMLGNTTVGRKAKLSIVALALLLGGCAGSFEEAKLAGMDPQARAAAPPPTEHCISLDSQHRTWGGVAKVSAVVAGAEGLSSIPVDDKKVRIGLAAGTAAAAALAAGAAYVSEDAAASWARECSQ